MRDNGTLQIAADSTRTVVLCNASLESCNSFVRVVTPYHRLLSSLPGYACTSKNSIVCEQLPASSTTRAPIALFIVAYALDILPVLLSVGVDYHCRAEAQKRLESWRLRVCLGVSFQRSKPRGKCRDLHRTFIRAYELVKRLATDVTTCDCRKCGYGVWSRPRGSVLCSIVFSNTLQGPLFAGSRTALQSIADYHGTVPLQEQRRCRLCQSPRI